MYRQEKTAWGHLLVHRSLRMVREMVWERVLNAQHSVDDQDLRSVDDRGLMFPLQLLSPRTLARLAEDLRDSGFGMPLDGVFAVVEPGAPLPMTLLLVRNICLRVLPYTSPPYPPFDLGMLSEDENEDENENENENENVGGSAPSRSE